MSLSTTNLPAGGVEQAAHPCRLPLLDGVRLFLLSSELEVLATLERQLLLELAAGAFHSQDNLLGGLGLLVKHRLSLTSETLLFPVVSPLTLSEKRCPSGLVLGDLVQSVLFACPSLAEGPSLFWNVNHFIVCCCFFLVRNSD